MAVSQQSKAMFSGDFLLPPLDLVINKLNYPAAALADHVIVMGSMPLPPVPGKVIFIAEAAVPDIHLADEVHLLENIQGTIDGGPRNWNTGVFQGEVDFIYLPVLVAAQDICQNGAALGSQTQVFALERLLEVFQFSGGNFHQQSY